MCIEHNIPVPEEEEVINNLDLGIYPPHIGNRHEEEAFRRVNPELLAGRRLRETVIRSLRQ